MLGNAWPSALLSVEFSVQEYIEQHDICDEEKGQDDKVMVDFYMTVKAATMFGTTSAAASIHILIANEYCVTEIFLKFNQIKVLDALPLDASLLQIIDQRPSVRTDVSAFWRMFGCHPL